MAELKEGISKQIPDEVAANTEYRNLARIAEGLGKIDIAEGLRQIALDEFKHRIRLDGMLKELMLANKRKETVSWHRK